MRIAICIVGQLRTAHLTAENYKKFCGGLWDQCDFFVHTWAENTPAPGFEIGPSYNAADYPRPLPTNHLKTFIDFYNPKRILIDRFKNYVQLPNLTTWMPIYYSIQQCLLLKQEYERDHKFYYDRVVVIRPDLAIDTEKFSLAKLLIPVNGRTFCYADMHNEKTNKVDTAIWAVANAMADDLMKFHSLYQTLPAPHVEDQIVLKDYLTSKNIRLIPLGFDQLWIYRNYHRYDWDISPNNPLECKNIDADSAIKERPL
jgi:hypothetical protein